MPQYFSWTQAWDGLKFHTPPGGLTKAAAVFGITGIGASEFFMYPYWCVEKGYARYAGKADGTRAWRSRVLGWTRVMQTDALCSMVIYTVATLAFYFLGAGILHGMGLVPASDQMIAVLSNMYTQTPGHVGAPAFLHRRNRDALTARSSPPPPPTPASTPTCSASWASSNATTTPPAYATAAALSGR